jgi:hypothetical protein
MTALVAALGWLTGSTAGRYLGIALLALAGLLVAWRIAVASGERKAELAMTQRALDNLRDRIATDDQIARLPPSARRERLRSWSNHGV